MEISPLARHDYAEVSSMLDRCFGADRAERTASLLRRGAPRLECASFVATQNGELLGSVECHLLLWQHADGTTKPIILLGPLASSPDYRGKHIGVRLMERALATANQLGIDVMLIGDTPYYGRWGFAADATSKWTLPGPVEQSRLLLRSATPATWEGPAHFSPAPASLIAEICTPQRAA